MTQDELKLVLEFVESINFGSRSASVEQQRQVIAVIKEALAQPEQEPVALPCCAYADASAVKWNPYNQVVQCHNCGQIYTTPPQRTQPNDIDLFWRAATTPEKWVGLTAEEVLQCWEKAHKPENEGLINAIRMADEVEKALKEKNCG